MSSQYVTEPPPTATVLLHTTAGPLTLSLFAQQAPLTCRNFLQHVLDGYYEQNIFHRISPGFVIQTGDPTGSGEGGENIYEDREYERYDEKWGRLMKLPEERKGEKIVFSDEIHTRLKFNRRGLVGMAKMQSTGAGEYGSQFFITLGDCRKELDRKCTMFGRVEGDDIYNVVKIAEGELIEGTERPVYPEKILRAEVLEMPSGEAWDAMKRKERVAERSVNEQKKDEKKKSKKKGSKALLSFGVDEGDDGGLETVKKARKAKFNTALIDGESEPVEKSNINGTSKKASDKAYQLESAPLTSIHGSSKRKADLVLPNSSSISPEPKRRKPSFHDTTTQLPIRNPESPSRSPTPIDSPPDRSSFSQKNSMTDIQSEIAAIKASMRRDTVPLPESKSKKSALESLIPATSTRGRKRPRPGDTNAKEDDKAMKMLNAFRVRLEGAAASAANETPSRGSGKVAGTTQKEMKAVRTRASKKASTNTEPVDETERDEDEAHLCDLHFIANCQSCSKNDDLDPDGAINVKGDDDDDDDARTFLTHSLSFAKDRLGKDLSWKKKNEEELVVIDPREKEKELLGSKGGGGKGHGKRRDMGTKEWDRDRKR